MDALTLPGVHALSLTRAVDTYLKTLIKPSTKVAYGRDIAAFSEWLGKPRPEALEALFAHGAGVANGLVMQYRSDLLAQLSPATVNRRLSTLKALSRCFRLVGITDWSIEVKGVKAAKLKDTRGPGAPAIRALIKSVALRDDAKGVRDMAMLRLLCDLALRRAEVVGIDFADVDIPGMRVQILGKGRLEKEWFSLTEASATAITDWIEEHPVGEGALFPSLSPNANLARLKPNGLYDVVRKWGIDIGVAVRPHGIRHTAITQALDELHGDVRSARLFSRHANVDTLQHYDDQRADVAGGVAQRVSNAWEEVTDESEGTNERGCQ